MSSLLEIKQKLKPTIVAEYYLGQPQRISGNNLIYKSPFRNERTPSFWVSNEKGIHDFGTSIHYDIISFVQELFKIDFKTSIRKLSLDFGVIDYDGPISNELTSYLIKRRQEELEMQKKIDSWFYETYSRICDELKMSQKIVIHVNGTAKQQMYFHISDLEGWAEVFIDTDKKDKVNLYKSRGEIEKCLNKF